MSLLHSILTNSARPAQPFVLLQSSIAQSSLPILRNIVAKSKGHVLLICFLYPPKIFTADREDQSTQIIDCTDQVPRYHDEAGSYRELILSTLRSLGAPDFPHIVHPR